MPKTMPKIEIDSLVNILHYGQIMLGPVKTFIPTAIAARLIAVEPQILAVRLDGEVFPTTQLTMPLLAENYGDLWYLVGEDEDDVEPDLIAAVKGTVQLSVPLPEVRWKGDA